MKRTLFLVLAVIIALLAGVFPAFAQEEEREELPEYVPYELADGYVFYAPDGWEVNVNEDTGVFTLTDGDLSIDIYLPAVLFGLVEYDEETERIALLTEAINVLYEVEDPEVKSFEDSLGEEVPYWDWVIEDDEIKGAMYLVPPSEGEYAIVDIYATTEIYEENFDLMTDMGTYGLTVEQAEGGETTGEPCTVSIEEAESVEMRVGPGENRAVIDFLPAGEEFTVTGAFTDDDENVWYQLDKDEVAPDSNATELWVAQADVNETGDCALVAETGAPPIIPSTGRNTGDSGSDSDDTGSAGGLVPAEGEWTLTLEATTLASCTGTETSSIPTSDLFEETTFTYDLSVSDDDGTISIGVNTLDETAPGNYIGSLDFGNGTNAQFYMFVQSATSASGKVIANFTQDGDECSTTVNFGMGH